MHRRIVIPRFGNQHCHDVRQAAAGKRQQFHCVIDRGRIAAIGLRDRVQLLDVVAPFFRSQNGFPCGHPVGVTTNCIDLSVVAEKTEWMRQLPGGESIR